MGANIHPIIRIGSPAVKLKTQGMGAKWTVERPPDGSLIDANTNPVAHELYLSELRTKVCPHYHAQILNQQRILLIPGFNERLNNPALIVAQNINTQFNLLMVLLAKQHCTGETCAAPSFTRTLIGDISNTPIQHAGQRLNDIITPAFAIYIRSIKSTAYARMLNSRAGSLIAAKSKNSRKSQSEVR